MIAINSRKLAIAALLATVLSAPASANESGTTTQQSAIGQTVPEAATVPGAPTIARESLQTPTSARIAPTAAPATVGATRAPKVAELRPAILRGGAYEFRPLMLGIGY